MNPTTHTPTPWRLMPGADEIHLMGDGDNKLVATFPVLAMEVGVAAIPTDEDGENLSFIVRACNSHEALVKALKGLIALAEDPAGSTLTLREVFGTFHKHSQIEGVAARAALAQAKE